MRRRLIITALFILGLVAIYVVIRLVIGGRPAIITHYPSVDGFEPAPRNEINVSFGNYNNRTNDYVSVDRSTANAVQTLLEESTGLGVRLLNDWTEVQEESADLQIVNNVPIGGVLYTIFLSPGWTRELNLPVILSGNGGFTSNNQRLYLERDNSLAVAVALSVRNGGTGLIAAMSNSGGTESLGIDEQSLQSVGEFFNWIDENGGDKSNAITWGISRGGLTALIWAANPLGLDYNVHTIFALSPATHLGSMSQLSLLTHPSLASLYSVASETSQQDPLQALQLWTGETVPEQADMMLSPIGMADKLIGKQVLISAGTHDSFYPLTFTLEFDRRLSELNITHALAVTLGGGHERNPFVFQTVASYLASLTSNEAFEFPTGRFYFVDQNPKSGNLDQILLQEYLEIHEIEANPHELPVTAEFPYQAGVGDTIDIWICGTAGDSVELTATSTESGETLFAYGGNLPEQECIVSKSVADVPPGEYRWTLRINGQEISGTNTPTRDQAGCGVIAKTIVTTEPPNPESMFAFNNNLSFGLIEYSNQSAPCKTPP